MPVLLSSLKKNYNLSKSELEERPILNRLALHSYRIVFDKYDIAVEPPKDIRAFLQQLRKVGKK
jgi:23S rRNA pseudouridine955/2504/2580 synthase/23S rRNA pseudouridine1911/1915/1917 synthase